MKKTLLLVCHIFLLCIISCALRAQVIITVAGITTEGYYGDTGRAVQCELHWPESVALDKSGNLYIADADNNVIRKVKNDTITTFAGNGFESGTGRGGFGGDAGPASAAKMYYPSGVAFDTSGNLYIADQKNHCVRQVNTSGTITTYAGNGTLGYSGDGAAANMAQLNYPTRVATDTFGNVYIADAGNHCIRKVDRVGNISTVAGNAIAGFSGDGAAATSAQLNAPQDIAVTKAGVMYIADYNNNRIRMVDVSGTISTYAGIGYPGFSGDSAAATTANIFLPSGIAADDSGNVFFSDFANSRVRKIDAFGIISTIAGNGIDGYSGDGGPALQARMKFPEGLAINYQGSVYMADKANNRVRFISATVGIKPVAGSAPAISAFPNPSADGVFNVNVISAVREHMKVSVSNMAGQKLYEADLQTNNPAVVKISVPPGIYFMSAVSANTVLNQKLIVQ